MAQEDYVQVPRRELEWLQQCSDLQMGDGDTARELAEKWLKGETALDVINRNQRRIGEPEIDR